MKLFALFAIFVHARPQWWSASEVISSEISGEDFEDVAAYEVAINGPWEEQVPQELLEEVPVLEVPRLPKEPVLPMINLLEPDHEEPFHPENWEETSQSTDE